MWAYWSFHPGDKPTFNVQEPLSMIILHDWLLEHDENRVVRLKEFQTILKKTNKSNGGFVSAGCGQ